MARYIFSRVGVRSPGSPTRTAADSVSRCDSRTSLTSSASADAIQVSRVSKPFLVSSSTSSPPRSTSPAAIEASGFSSNDGTAPTHTSSTGSVSSSTSYPLARNASMCGDRSSAARESPVA